MIQGLAVKALMRALIQVELSGEVQVRSIMKINGMTLRKVAILIKEMSTMIKSFKRMKTHTKENCHIEYSE